MKQTYTTLTGRWMGRFEYDRGGKPTAFEAELTEEGSLSGQVFEPNGFRKDMGSELMASLDGARAGQHVSFVKRYAGFGQGDDPIYDGTVDAGLTRIEGRWRFTSIANWGGRFVMIRKPQASSSSDVKIAETVDN